MTNDEFRDANGRTVKRGDRIEVTHKHGKHMRYFKSTDRNVVNMYINPGGPEYETCQLSQVRIVSLEDVVENTPGNGDKNAA